MAAAAPQKVKRGVLDERELVQLWREERLLELGLQARDAYDLSFYRDLDWHHAERLIRLGCPPELVPELLI